MTGDLGRTLGWVLIVLGVGLGIAGVYVGRSVSAHESPAVTAPITQELQACPEPGLKEQIEAVQKVCEQRLPAPPPGSPPSADAGQAAIDESSKNLRVLAGNLVRFYCECFTKLNTPTVCTDRLIDIDRIKAVEQSFTQALNTIGTFGIGDNNRCVELAKGVGGWQ